jgi:diguanylate cyclase (GGDEF)-like protein
MRNAGARVRSLRKLHLASLSGIFLCLVVAVGAGYLLLSDVTALANTGGNVVVPLPVTSFVYVGLILAALGGIVVISLTLYRSADDVRDDIRALVSMFKDVREGAVRVEYPVEFAEFAVAQRYLRGWGAEMLAEKERLKDMGLIDHLSQLSNRRHFEMRLKELFDNVRTHGPSSVLIMDIDYFKQVNDRHGHDAGDALIVRFASALHANVRHTDMLARFGGDEFCILYAYVPLAKASVLADRLRRALPREIELKPGALHALRWSGGLSAIQDADEKPEDVLRRADQALLRAKEAGRNRTVINNPETGIPTPPIAKN